MEKIQQLLSAVGVDTDTAVAQNPDAQDHEWHEPHYFNTAQNEKLNAFANMIASSIATKFGQFFQDTFEATAEPITQHYAGKFISRIFEEAKSDYYLVLKSGDSACGLTIIPDESASTWLGLLLGESESKDSEKGQLSNLEQSLLSDIVNCLSDAIVNTNQQLNLTAAKNVVREHFSLDLNDSTELCQMTIDVKQKESENPCQLQLLLPCEKLLPICGDTQVQNTMTPEQVKGLILEHAKELPVEVTANFAQTELTFEQILTLQEGDILMLNKRVGETVEIVIEGKTRFLGLPVKTNGKLAVQITQTKEVKES